MHRQLVTGFSVWAIIAVSMAGCANTGVPLGAAYADYGEYLSIDAHYKAFATTRARNSGQSWGWAFAQRTPQAAIDAALESCGGGRSSETTLGSCVVHSIGNRDISTLSGDELQEAIRQYKANPNIR